MALVDEISEILQGPVEANPWLKSFALRAESLPEGYLDDPDAPPDLIKADVTDAMGAIFEMLGAQRQALMRLAEALEDRLSS